MSAFWSRNLDVWKPNCLRFGFWQIHILSVRIYTTVNIRNLNYSECLKSEHPKTKWCQKWDTLAFGFQTSRLRDCVPNPNKNNFPNFKHNRLGYYIYKRCPKSKIVWFSNTLVQSGFQTPLWSQVSINQIIKLDHFHIFFSKTVLASIRVQFLDIY